MSFLSRSFHESLTTADASKLVKFKVEADGKIAELPTPTEPSLFYSRPKGDYKGEETKTLLLDFFVSNATLGADSFKVKANINGQDFTLDQWVPYEILNLPKGEATIKLTLVDKDGNPVTIPAGESVTVTLTYKEPTNDKNPNADDYVTKTETITIKGGTSSTTFENITKVPKLIEVIESRGYSKEDIEKIKYKNFLRIIKEIVG